MIFDKNAKTLLWEMNLFNKLFWENRISTYKRINLDLYTKINSKRIEYLNVSPKIIRRKHRTKAS